MRELANRVEYKGDTVAIPIKVIPQPGGQPSIKAIVNIYPINDEHFEDQAIKLKKLYYQFKARRIIIDGNGLGFGLMDYMVKPQSDFSGESFPPFGVYNDEDGTYKKFRTNDTEDEAIYIMRATPAINTDMYTSLQVQLRSGKLKFLIDERVTKAKLLATKAGQKMTPEQRKLYLRPYVYTTILRDELLNLREENEGVYIRLKQANRNIKKDTVSALGYGLYYIKHEEDSKRKKKKFNVKDMMFFT